jgi:hypothetical protein
MKHIIFLFLFGIFLFQSCKKIDVNEGVPSYISIPSIEVVTDPANEGSNSHKITDAWVYFDNNLQGVYPLPASFPVLLSGKQNISIKAGIKNNGIAATRVKYPFYDYFNAVITLTKDSVTVLNPEVYYANVDSIIFEDFEFNNPILNQDTIIDITKNSDTTYLSNNTIIFEGNSLGAHLASPHNTFEIAIKKIQLPKVGTPVYVELNYKCNTAFQVGVYANLTDGVVANSIVTINPKNEWNKIYIDLTSTISNTNYADSHTVFISMERDTASTEMAELYLDNFKIVY